MPRRSCSVCGLPPDLRSHGEELIVQGKEYREVVLLAPGGPSKSSWHRHMQTCFRKRRFYSVGKHTTDKEERLIFEWSDQTFTLYGQPFDGQFRESDTLLKIVYEQKEIRNPDALAQESLESPSPEEQNAARPDDPEPKPKIEPPPTPEPPPPCEHTWTAITSNAQRCSNCGVQRETTFQAVGVSRADYQRRSRSFADRKLFGRFG